MWLQERISKKMCSVEIGLRTQNVRTILDSIVNINWEDSYDHLMSTRIFTW